MSHNVIELKLAGNIPAKKNSRINRRDGMSFPSREFEAWQSTAIQNVRIQTRAKFAATGHVMTGVYFLLWHARSCRSPTTGLLAC
jgi:hypothetical protein